MKRMEMMSEEYMIGRKFGRLLVIERGPEQYAPCGQHRDMWVCKCDCGNVKTIAEDSLRYNKTKSCGCLGTENLIKRSTKHNKFGTRIYNLWGNMNYRCNNERSDHYQYYGGRGIKVCDEWQEFEPFYDWAMSHGYSDDLTIDRIDVNGNYCPENCRWVTPKEQANNRRNTRYLTYNGETKCVKDWENETGIQSVIIKHRIDYYGWNVEMALTESVGARRKK